LINNEGEKRKRGERGIGVLIGSVGTGKDGHMTFCEVKRGGGRGRRKRKRGESKIQLFPSVWVGGLNILGVKGRRLELCRKRSGGRKKENVIETETKKRKKVDSKIRPCSRRGKKKK